MTRHTIYGDNMIDEYLHRDSHGQGCVLFPLFTLYRYLPGFQFLTCVREECEHAGELEFYENDGFSDGYFGLLTPFHFLKQ